MHQENKTEKVAREKEIDVELLKKKRKRLSNGSFLKKRWRFFVYFFLIALFFYIFFYSPLFEIEHIEIRGLNHLDESNIYDEISYLEGENFFLSDLPTARSKIVGENIFVEEIHTEKVFPNTVIVNITEREPFLLANNAITGCHLLDLNGYVLSPEGSSCSDLRENYNVIEIVGIDIDNFEFLYGTTSQFYLASKIHEIMNVLSHYAYRVEAMQLNNQVLDIELTNDRTIVFSLSDDLDLQFKRLIILTQQIRTDSIDFEMMDLRFERPVLLER